MKQTLGLFYFALLLFSLIHSTKVQQENSCQKKSSTYCDKKGVDRIACYEIYYYLYNLKRDFFNGSENKLINFDESSQYEECDICSTLEKCSYSDCLSVNVGLSKKDQNYVIIEKINNSKSTPHFSNMSVGFLEMKENLKNNITNADSELLKSYQNIIKNKVKYISSSLEILSGIYEKGIQLQNKPKGKEKLNEGYEKTQDRIKAYADRVLKEVEELKLTQIGVFEEKIKKFTNDFEKFAQIKYANNRKIFTNNKRFLKNKIILSDLQKAEKRLKRF